MNDSSSVLAVIRKALLAVFVLGVAATIVELFLLEHTEGWQIAPLVLLGLSLLILGWHWFSKSKMSVQVFQATTLFFIVAGFVGIALHYNGNVEFEMEMYPSLSDFDLFMKALHGAFPALAPGMMIHLGLLGLAYTYKHPLLTNQSSDKGE